MVPTPKIVNLEGPNKYIIMTIMNICSKIMSRILTNGCFSLLGKHGIEFQFGGTPKIGFQDEYFTLKTLLYLRRQHNIETYVCFTDLIKAFDTANPGLIIDIPKKYETLPRFCSVIERLYTDLKVVLQIGK